MDEMDKFLLNEDLQDQIFDATYGKIKIHKEIYDDRFIILYVKDYTVGLSQREYSVGGYFDIKDKVIYDCDYTLSKVFKRQDNISKRYFDDLKKEFLNKIYKYIEKYSFENKEELIKLATEKYNSSNDYRINGYESDVRQLFITCDEPKIELSKFYNIGDVTYSDEYHNKNIFIDYLNFPEETINKYANIIINNNKEDLGLALLLYKDKTAYLHRLEMNHNDEFKEVHINRKIYEAIKDIDAKTLNITINYNNKEIIFKFDYASLKRSLQCDERYTCAYGVSYEKVSNFIKENKVMNGNSRRTEDFEFSHITSITYGKKDLYKKVIPIKNKIKDRGER